MPATETAIESPSLQQAFDEAVKTHAAPAVETPPPAAAEEVTEPAKVEPAVPVEPVLLTDAEFGDLTKTQKDPAKVLAELNKVFTQKTQTLAAERKALTKAQPYMELIEAFETDKEGTLAKMAKEMGFTLNKDTVQTEAAAKPAVDDTIAEFKKSLGPEYEYLAEALAPAVSALVQRVTAGAVEPLKKEQATILSKQAEDETTKVMAAFETKRPGWKKHEPAMLALSQKVQPHGMGELDYLDHLYTMVTMDERIADGVKQHIAKVTKAAAESEGAPGSTVPDGQVKTPAPGKPSFREAAAAALRGERFD